MDLVTADSGALSLLRGIDVVPTDGVVQETRRTLLAGAFPNPARTTVRFRFTLARGGDVDLRVFDVAGRIVQRHQVAKLPAGENSLTWNGLGRDGMRAAAGVYFVELRADGIRQARRFVLLN
jgi:hypothetical protein